MSKDSLKPKRIRRTKAQLEADTQDTTIEVVPSPPPVTIEPAPSDSPFSAYISSAKFFEAPRPTIEVVENKKPKVVDSRSLFEKIKELATSADGRSIKRAEEVNARSGTVAITSTGALLFLPNRSPENGGRTTLERTGKVQAFVADL